MTREEGMALAPWGSLGGGNFTVQEKESNKEQGRNFHPRTEEQRKMGEKLAKVAEAKNTLITSVALAYVRHKAPYVFPIVGGRKVDHLKGNIEALGLQLTDEEIDDIDSATDFSIGFPMNFLFELTGGKYNSRMTSSDIGLLKYAGNLDSVPVERGVKPHGM
jgi:aryl-alcohol dehydrogenase-like predicted oxidoreductase